MSSQIVQEQIQPKIDSSNWKKRPFRMPDAPNPHVEESNLTNFRAEDKATTLGDLATTVFTDIPDGFERQPLETQHAM
jgi:hypothetical protein